MELRELTAALPKPVSNPSAERTAEEPSRFSRIMADKTVRTDAETSQEERLTGVQDESFDGAEKEIAAILAALWHRPVSLEAGEPKTAETTEISGSDVDAAAASGLTAQPSPDEGFETEPEIEAAEFVGMLRNIRMDGQMDPKTRIAAEDAQLLDLADRLLTESEIDSFLEIPRDLEAFRKELASILEELRGSESGKAMNRPAAPTVFEEQRAVPETPASPREIIQTEVNKLLRDVRLDARDDASDSFQAVLVPSQEQIHFRQMTTETAPAARAIVRQVQDGISAQIRFIASENGVEIKLSPEHLGKVDLKLNLHREAVQAEIRVENQIVKAAVEAGLADLKQSLGQRGYEVRNIVVTVSEDSGKGGGQAFYQQREGRRENGREGGKKSDYLEILSRLEIEETMVDYYG